MELSGFILAGGHSTRIGRDKALLPVGDRSLIEVVVERVRPHVEHLVVIGNRQNAPQLAARSVDGVVTDLVPDRGPLMGIYTGLLRTETALNLFVPCDMPWIDDRLIERLLGAWEAGDVAVASRHPREGVQPFPLVCHIGASVIIGALLDRQERSIQALLRQPSARLVTVEQPALWRSFMNVNTFDDYAALCQDTPLAPRS